MSYKVTRLGPPRIRRDTLIIGDVVFEAADLAPVIVEDEGTPLATAASTLDFVGAGVTASGTGGTKTITIPGGTGIVVEDEGTPLTTDADTLDFVGAGVTATGAGATKTITIPGGAAGTAASIQFIIDGGGTAITTGVKGYLEVPFGCTITAARMLADVSGSIVVDIWKDTYANYPPDNSDSITASAPPTISTAVKSEDTTLTGWTTSISAGNILGYNVDSATTVTRVTVALTVTKT